MRISSFGLLFLLIPSCQALSNSPSGQIKETPVLVSASPVLFNTILDECTPSLKAGEIRIHSTSQNAPDTASTVTELNVHLESGNVDKNNIDSNSTVPNFQSFEEWKRNKLNQFNNSKSNNLESTLENNNKEVLNNHGVEVHNRLKQNSNSTSSNIKSNSTSKLSKDFKQLHQQRNRKREDGESNHDDNQLGDDMVIEISMFTGSDEDQGKLYKDRFNFASFDCAATIVKTNKEAKGANSILLDNKDIYLLNECSAQNKFIIIELCEDILVDEVLIGNYEFYSSMFKDLKIFVSDRFPTTQWYLLGGFQAENIRKLQSFNIENPLIWTKFIKIEFLSHYGNEFYCPISSVQVHGTTMIEQFKDENPDIDESNDDAVVVTVNKNISMLDNIKPEFDVKFDQFTNDIHFKDLDGELGTNCTSSIYLKLDQFLNDYEKKQDENFDQCLIDDYMDNSNDETGQSKTIETKSFSFSQIPKVQPQDSIYKNLAKRLSLLESNATLSLLYIEEQSKLLSEAFAILENEQSIKFQNILIQLNTTIQSQMTIFQKLNMDVYTSFSRLFEYQQQNFDERTNGISQEIDHISNMISLYKTLTYLCIVIIVSMFIYILMTKSVYIIDESYSRLSGTAPSSPSISPSTSLFNMRQVSYDSSMSSRQASYSSEEGKPIIIWKKWSKGSDEVDIDPFTPEASQPSSPKQLDHNDSDYVYEE
ncbi:hypothetical protein C6P40_001165 [Pichia californica]|uniref:SUN-like protein 1 n=1 Tax=Pichia californica TaxID=460514 RepID=A0A9P6WJW2_9ASCO|nr:hypothetical protein C6P40_001165 [[Candida] californica]